VIPMKYIETQKAIHEVKTVFEKKLSKTLRLTKVVAPQFLIQGTGLQDDLAGTQLPVQFKTRASNLDVEIVHSLAKWKRATLSAKKFPAHTGLLTDMRAIRKDEDIDEIHSIFVDQWDWEVVIDKTDRTIPYLKSIVRKIYRALYETEKIIAKKYGIAFYLPKKITFIHTETLERDYPLLDPRMREDAVAKKYGAVFIIGIGHPLISGKPHDIRASDYDDWSTVTMQGRGLDGDIIVWDPVREKALELSSMGIRVDKRALEYQLKHCGEEHKRMQPFHKKILAKEMALTIGGGVGQSRVCQFILKKRHIGEVQCSVWSEKIKREAARQEIILLE